MSFLKRYEDLGESFDPTSISLRKALRVNTLKTSTQELFLRLQKKDVTLKRVPFLKIGFWYEAEFSLGATPEYLQGLYYLQEAASQLPPIVLNPLPGELVLDMAAAPGSKTTQMAALMNNTGAIVAFDSDAHRLASLRNNIERLGITNVASYKKDARFAKDAGVLFDKVLLDAPCSGNFCVEPDYFSVKSLAGIKQRARLQKELLKSAYQVLKKNGTLVYSTCSLEPEENELVIDWFINKFPDMALESTSLDIGDPGLINVFGQELSSHIAKTRRFWPHKTGLQGFYIAKLVKSS